MTMSPGSTPGTSPGSARITTLLIANRGEIALRVMRTADRLGIRTVAIYTAVDADAPHTRAADEAVEVPSYVDVDAVVAAAIASGADAVHPGYGFLSERAVFASALEEAGIRLVGPSARVMDAMGRKDAAREIAVAAGVPVVPSYDPTSDPSAFAYPVLVKAAAGGGGKGMRVVRSAADYPEALAAARREAASAFGDDAMLVEKYVERGRHVEVQVLGDDHGDVVHLHERDCSAQRRHQKVLEEAPAPGLPEATRAAMHEAAVALSRQVGYSGAGTVEFLLDTATADFYFLEMNTRLQVEHPVTEEVHRLHGQPVDLVELQLHVASGGHVPAQSDLVLVGHAIEARVYAEDPYAGFLPQAGTATLVRWPEGEGIRVDHALESGQVVSTSFDPMLGKVIAVGEDREQARETLVRALDATAVLGLTTNTGFLRALAAHEAFRDVGSPTGLDTAWLDRIHVPAEVPRPDERAARAAAALALRFELDATPRGPWQPDGFRLAGPPGPLVEHGHELPSHGWSAVTAPGPDGLQRVSTLEHGEALVRRDRHGTEVVVRGQYVDLRPPPPGSATADHTGDLQAPMPGTVLDVRVAVGKTVEEGQVLGVLEAMKMELALKAPYAGTVTVVDATVGRQVPLGHVLFHVEQEA